MSFNQSVPSGRIITQEGENVTGLLTQSPNGTTSTVAAAGTPVANDIQVGTPFLLSVRCTGAGPNFAIYSKNAPWKFKVVKAWYVMTGAGASSDTVKLESGDGAASETFASLHTAVADVSSASDGDQALFATLLDSTSTVAAGGSLRAVTASSAAVDVYALCIRVK